MVKITQVIGFSRSGLADFIIQRVTAYILAAYTLLLLGYLLLSADLTYASWKELFEQTWMRVFTLLAILSICAHAWIGMWTIGTDYIRAHYFGARADGIRLLYQIICIIALLVYLIWGIKILWGS